MKRTLFIFCLIYVQINFVKGKKKVATEYFSEINVHSSLVFFFCLNSALDFSYVGCFVDRIGDRDFQLFIGDSKYLTVEQCLHACQTQKSLYAAIQFGNECRCGDTYGRHGSVSDDQCSYRCSEKDSCGGEYRNSVYRLVDSGSYSSLCDIFFIDVRINEIQI